MNLLFLGFYFGVLFSVLIYNLQWYINTKEKSYLYYVLMQFFMLLFSLHKNLIFETSILFSGVLAFIFSILFIKEFLNLDKYYKKSIQYMPQILIGLFIVVVILYIFDIYKILREIIFVMITMQFLFITYSIYKKGLEISKYFLLGWGVVFLFLLVAYLEKLYTGRYAINYLYEIANLLQAIFLSFALSQKTKQLIKEKKEQEQMLIHQSRLVSMGEMLANISHQWRQPLNRIASFIINMQVYIMDNYPNEKHLPKKLEESQLQLEYMSQTIDDFTNFYKKDKKKEKFYVSTAIEISCKIIESSLKSSNIKLEINIVNDFILNSYKKELSQVILNLLQNAQEALLINNITNPKIKIRIDKHQISIEDNAGGISDKIVNNIFDPYFSTKEKYKGTGLGLYMSKIIIEKNMNAKIYAQNVHKGALLTLVFD